MYIRVSTPHFMSVLCNLQSRTTTAHLATRSSFAKINIHTSDYRRPKQQQSQVLHRAQTLSQDLGQNMIIDVFRGVVADGQAGRGVSRGIRVGRPLPGGRVVLRRKTSIIQYIKSHKELRCQHCSSELRGACR